MEKRSKSFSVLKFLPFVALLLASTFLGGLCEVSLNPTKKKSTQSSPGQVASSFVFPVAGNVYPLGWLLGICPSSSYVSIVSLSWPKVMNFFLIEYYSVSLNIGNPPKVYELDIDTGSDLTWVQCDAPCTGCTKPRDQLYKPKNNLVSCADPLCSAIHSPGNFHCKSPKEQCDYEVGYADQGSSLGVLVLDRFALQLINGSQLGVRMTFGCGYDQHYPATIPAPTTSGFLGLGNGKASFISQLQALALTKNMIGHCLSGRGGGFLFFGSHLVPSSGIMWTPMASNSLDKHYSSGPADLLFGGQPTGMKGLFFIFDSGSSYTYFNAQVYQTTLNLIMSDLKGKPLKDAPEEKALPLCWKGTKPFKSVHDVASYFKSLALSFTKTRNVQLQLPPQDYLVVTEHGNACLGILNGAEVGLANLNIIGDIFLQDKIVVYDNERQRIGWASANCNKIPKP